MPFRNYPPAHSGAAKTRREKPAMTADSRTNLRDYYNRAADNYLSRTSRGVRGWLRRKEFALTLDMIPAQDCRRALDAGCGPAHYSRVMRDRGFDVTAVDLSPEMVAKAADLGFPAFVMDIEHSDPPEGLNPPFDYVYCAGVVEYADDAERFLKSLRLMTADDGEMLIVAPMDGVFGRFYSGYMVAKGIGCRLYTTKSLTKALQASGFEPVEIRVARPICLAVRARPAPMD